MVRQLISLPDDSKTERVGCCDRPCPRKDKASSSRLPTWPILITAKEGKGAGESRWPRPVNQNQRFEGHRLTATENPQ